MEPQHLPPIAGREKTIHTLRLNPPAPSILPGHTSLEGLQAAFACALHMHQPTVPAGIDGALISHLQYMVERPGEGDNHNAEPFAQCYRRMADLIPELIREGCKPRIMLDYSGNLLWGVMQMGRDDITEALRYLACDDQMQRHVEWLGTFWSHAVAPSTPIPDLALQISAWQHQFADLFGDEALQRVQGFSLPEMHLPNHPDTLFALVKALKEAGYRWMLVQEHSVEQFNGTPLEHAQRYLPNQLVARNSSGEEISMTVLIKTQGSDTKLVGQMQPCYEAMGLASQHLNGKDVPSLVSQIADGENGGVMMNEFPEAFRQANRRIRDGEGNIAALNGSEYLAHLDAIGVETKHFPRIQPVLQHRLWREVGEATHPDAVSTAIETLTSRGDGFSMQGASWTNNLSWVEGYSNVLEPMQSLSAQFHQRFDAAVATDPSVTATPAYQQALLHVLLLETSCFRYWGQGLWTEFAQEINRRGQSALATEP
ncbi:glycosyl hydrolase family 57 [Synechococcus sp. A10-1-5-9]|uniref:glycosyl hydrolase family 57 n=1 Tax=Synechococcus sp. A10-1-5-9 TaxID=3392295 RepID=UPI0039ECC981